MSNLRRIVVLGAGLAGWMAAACLARALKRVGTEVLQVSAAGAPTPPVLASLPSLETFHRSMGFDQRDLMRAADGNFRLGTLHADTNGIHAYGETGMAFGAVPFHLAWRAHAAELSPSKYGAYCLAALAARAGRYAPPISDGPAGSSYSPGLHLSGPAYQRFLEKAALHYGAKPAGKLGAEGIDSQSGLVILEDGTAIECDLVVDTLPTSNDKLLVGFAGLPDKLSVRYGRRQACDSLGLARLHSVSGSRAIDIPLENEVHRTLISISDGADHRAGSILRKHGYEPLPDSASTYQPGRTQNPWTGKVVRIGDAACRLPPVEAVELRIIQIGLETLLQLLPASGPSGPERSEYNRVASEAYQALADFVSIAFLSPGPLPAGLSPTLRTRLENFTSRGRIVLTDGESFTRESWAAALIAYGWRMDRADAHASALPQDRVRANLEGIAGTLVATNETLPDQRTFLRRAGLLNAQKTGTH